MDTQQTLNEARKCIRYITQEKESHYKPAVWWDDYSLQTIFAISVFPFQDQSRFACVVWPLEIALVLRTQAATL